MTTVVSIERFDDCDIYIRQNEVEAYGYPAETTFGEMVDKALANNCVAITKNGGGKWYLKALGQPYNTVNAKATEAAGKFPRMKTWVIRRDE